MIDVDLPARASSSTSSRTTRANGIKMQALKILDEDAMKSFSRGSKAAADFVDAYSKRIAKP